MGSNPKTVSRFRPNASNRSAGVFLGEIYPNFAAGAKIPMLRLKRRCPLCGRNRQLKSLPTSSARGALKGDTVPCKRCVLLRTPETAGCYVRLPKRPEPVSIPSPGEPPVVMGLLPIVGPCSDCGVRGWLTTDHVVPPSRGGVFVVYACPWCNASKGNRTLHEWLQGMDSTAPQQYFVPLLISHFPFFIEKQAWRPAFPFQPRSSSQLLPPGCGGFAENRQCFLGYRLPLGAHGRLPVILGFGRCLARSAA